MAQGARRALQRQMLGKQEKNSFLAAAGPSRSVSEARCRNSTIAESRLKRIHCIALKRGFCRLD